MIDHDTNPTQDTEHHLREPETLAKVLPAGGPLLPGHPAHKFPTWQCERCRLVSPEKQRASCMQGHASGCPMVESAA